jgi:hypothetical protein
MNASELYKEVARLGFETTLDDAITFYYAANRALFQVARELPEERTVTIAHYPITNEIKEVEAEKIYRCENGNNLIFEALGGGVCVSFETDAPTGMCYVDELIKGKWEQVEIFTLPTEPTDILHVFKRYSKVFNENKTNAIRLRFASDENIAYSVKNAAIFKSTYKHDAAPRFSRMVEYDMRIIADDFLEFSAPITVSKNTGKESAFYETSGDATILFPYDKEGAYNVKYHKRPHILSYSTSPSADTTTIDLTEEKASLLPLLVASYVWIEDEPEKATHYLDLYKTRVNEIIALRRNYAPVKYVTNGW